MEFKVVQEQKPVLRPSVRLSKNENDNLVKALRKYFIAYNELNGTSRYNSKFSEIRHIEIEGVAFEVEVQK